MVSVASTESEMSPELGFPIRLNLQSALKFHKMEVVFMSDH